VWFIVDSFLNLMGVAIFFAIRTQENIDDNTRLSIKNLKIMDDF